MNAVEVPFLDDCLPDEEILILVGLGRPWAGYFQHILIDRFAWSNINIGSLSFLLWYKWMSIRDTLYYRRLLPPVLLLS